MRLMKLKKQLRKLKNNDLFSKISRSSFYISRHFEMYNCNLGGARVHLQFNGLTSRDDRTIDRVVKDHTPSYPTLPGDHPLVEEFHSIEKTTRKLKERRENISAQVEGSLSSFTTIKKLLDAWPESKELLPKEVTRHVVNLPAVKVKDLNALIGLPKGEDNDS